MSEDNVCQFLLFFDKLYDQFTDLAEIQGYETKNFKRQVKNNIAKFEGDDFMFELNDEEVEELSRCKNSNNRIFPCGAVLCYRFLFGKHRCQKGNEV